MKTLYFDINGTLTFQYTCKPALAGGAFERGVRAARFDRLVCVSNFQKHIAFLEEMGKKPDALAILFDACFGAFADPAWFRQVTSMVADSDRRAHSIVFSEDWWYVDDNAREYCAAVGLSNLFDLHRGTRILCPRSDSDGSEILEWLRATP